MKNIALNKSYCWNCDGNLELWVENFLEVQLLLLEISGEFRSKKLVEFSFYIKRLRILSFYKN